MEKLETTKEFVLSAHQEACKDLKLRIEEEFPFLFEVKLEKNKWYKVPNTKSIVFYGGGKRTFGIAYDGTWIEDWFMGINNTTYILATPTEIESMLWKEAEKRGIWKDTKIDECMYYGNTEDLNKGGYIINYDSRYDELWNLNGCIYKQGKFATPLDTNKEIKETISRLEKELAELKEKVK